MGYFKLEVAWIEYVHGTTEEWNSFFISTAWAADIQERWKQEKIVDAPPRWWQIGVSTFHGLPCVFVGPHMFLNISFRSTPPQMQSWPLGLLLWWWFQMFFIFTPICGRFPFWRAYFSVGWKPRPRWHVCARESLQNLYLPWLHPRWGTPQ